MGHIIPIQSSASEIPPAGNPELGREAIRTDGVYVVHTSVDETLAAMRVASELAKALNVPLTLVHNRRVPLLSVDAPNGPAAVANDDLLHRFLDAAREAEVDLRVRVYVCRKVQHVVPLAFKPHSLIVIAGQRNWWPALAQRWRRALEAAGHFVMFVDHAEHKESVHV
jgi:hypothetical protein